jgi:hypothetical protein
MATWGKSQRGKQRDIIIEKPHVYFQKGNNGNMGKPGAQRYQVCALYT